MVLLPSRGAKATWRIHHGKCDSCLFLKTELVYIMINKTNIVLYTGFSSDLPGRVTNHKNKVVKWFTKRYNVDKLVYYETCECREGALFREKQIKAGSRQKKIDLINKMNPEWRDLYEEL